MNDIWDEKPTWKRRMTCVDYIKKRNAWLVKLKAEYESMESQITLLKLDIEALGKENRILQNIGDSETP